MLYEVITIWIGTAGGGLNKLTGNKNRVFIRITSYNVCYTKLLRTRQLVQTSTGRSNPYRTFFFINSINGVMAD